MTVERIMEDDAVVPEAKEMVTVATQTTGDDLECAMRLYQWYVYGSSNPCGCHHSRVFSSRSALRKVGSLPTHFCYSMTGT